MADGITSLDALNYGQSTGGSAGSAETTSTLGIDRQDSRTPPGLFHVWAAQLNAIKNVTTKITQDLKGGTRFATRTQTANPFGAGESGFYMDTSGVAYKVFNGTPTALSGGGSTGNFTFSSNTMDLSGAAVATLFPSTATGVNSGGSLFGFWSNTGSRFTMTQRVLTTGTQTSAFTVNGGAHTGLTASTELVDINFGLNRTVQFATGALTTQRAFLVQAPTYAFVAASTLTNAATLAISGAPAAGTNATITNAFTLWLQAGNLAMAANTSIVNSAQAATNTTALTVAPNVADGASSIALKLNNGTTASSAGFKDLSVQQSSVEQWFVGYPASTTIPELRGAGANIGMRNSSGTGVVCQGANDLYVYGANAINWHFLANNYFEPTNDNAYTFGNNTNRLKANYGYWYDTRLGAQLTAAATITPTSALHHVTGATTINTIALTNVPTSGNVFITLIADSTITFAATTGAGAIKVAPSATLASGKAMTFVLDNATQFWYPVQGA